MANYPVNVCIIPLARKLLGDNEGTIKYKPVIFLPIICTCYEKNRFLKSELCNGTYTLHCLRVVQAVAITVTRKILII